MNDDHCKPASDDESAGATKNLLDFFRSSPLIGADLDLERLDAGSVPQTRELGVDRGNVHVADDFDAPNDDITELFEDP